MRVVFDDGRLIKLANDARFVNEFPFLRRINDTAPKAGCGCQRSKVNTAALAGARQAIGLMSKDQKRKLLGLVGAEEGQVTYLDAKRKRQTVIF